jgi:hypothetical protein
MELCRAEVNDWWDVVCFDSRFVILFLGFLPAGFCLRRNFSFVWLQLL